MTDPSHLNTTRAFYDAVVDDYAARFKTVLDYDPLARAMLTAFAETVRAAGAGPVADLGSGPGLVTAFLHSLGLDVSGLDLSPAMVELARRDHPGLRFDEGSMTDLDIPDGTLAGVVAWYSIIHTPAELLPDVFAGFHRVLAPGGHLLVAFQVGDEPLRLEKPFGHPVSLDFRRLSLDHVADLLGRAGFAMTSRTLRETPESELSSQVPQGYLMARKPPAS
ncbi:MULTISPECIES: class I SAM-dependent DNA methyltransferase [Thermomonosporaceae]|uniref:class I SAM-dependent DNA methyltransferase n=1 Tax=Thermomonosporaceae TaxID=2012 RepID=UPI00255A7652|nr:MULTISPECIES: class I SAM-dependent methyltransferase [Thermomonosporaceae]MDL4772117.1 methyltransferase domain-containing protein [Actinomadura xylanilytica]